MIEHRPYRPLFLLIPRYILRMCSLPCSVPPSSRRSSGWVDNDSHASFVSSLRSVTDSALARFHGTIKAPQLVPGTIYSVQYSTPFSYTRVGDTNCWVQPDQQSNLQYCWRGVCEVTPTYRTNNYMYVVGFINGTQRKQVLLLFYNPSSTLKESCCDSSSVNQSVWLPAVYSYETGTIFSEIGVAQIEGTRPQQLCWTSISNDYVRVDGDTMGKMVGYARVCATELCDCGQLQVATEWLRFILCQFTKDLQFARFVDLSAVLFALENGGAVISRPSCKVPEAACCPPVEVDYTLPKHDCKAEQDTSCGCTEDWNL